MTRVWQTGFEENTSTASVELTTLSGTASIQSSVVRTGTYALRVNPSASTGFVRHHVAGSNQTTIGYMRFYLRVDTLPSANTYICKFADTSNNQMSGIKITTTGALQLTNAAASQVGSDSTTTLSTGTWYRIELKNDATTGTGTLDARINGVSFASGNNSAQGSWGRVLVGVITASATADFYFDDWCVNDSTGSAQTSWPGEGQIIHLFPNGDGDNHAWVDTANSAGTSNNYQLVDEVPPNDVTDYVQSVTLNAEDMYAMTNSGLSSSDTINVVMVAVRFSNNTADATTAFRAQIKKTASGTITQSASIIPNSVTWVTNAIAEPRNYPLITYLDPDGAVWTASTLDSMQAGVKLTAAGTNRIRVSAVWVSVDYTPATQVSSSDTGAGADAGSVSAATSSGDTGAGVDGSSISATQSNAETGSGVDSGSVSAAVTSPETAAGVDSASITSAATSSSETASGADGATVGATLSSAETAGAAETAVITASFSQSDSAASLDTEALTVSISVTEAGAAVESNDPIALSAADTASAVDFHAPLASSSQAENAASADDSSVHAEVFGSDSGSGADSANVDSGNGNLLFENEASFIADDASVSAQVFAFDAASGVDSGFPTYFFVATDTAVIIDQAEVLSPHTDADSAAGSDVAVISLGAATSTESSMIVETQSVSVTTSAGDTATSMDSAVVTVYSPPVIPGTPHRVKPYYIRDPQPWAVEQERRRHNQALWQLGETAMFCLMWHIEDFKEQLVERCRTCFTSQGQITEVYGQADHNKCLDCFGTTFDKGVKALIVRPAIFSDSDESETFHSRGVIHPNDLSIESTPDFRIRTGDYCFRSTGDRYYLRVPERVTLRTGFAEPNQSTSAIGYNHANAAVEDPSSVAYLIPPANDELPPILQMRTRIPRDWANFEVIRAPLIPGEIS